MRANQAVSGQIIASLEVLAERVGDPFELIYRDLFALDPRYSELFFLDPNGDVRGEMLSQAFDILMKADANDGSAAILVKANRFAHDGYGVSPEEFDRFFSVIRDVTKSVLAEDWTPDMSARWDEVLQQLTG